MKYAAGIVALAASAMAMPGNVGDWTTPATTPATTPTYEWSTTTTTTPATTPTYEWTTTPAAVATTPAWTSADWATTVVTAVTTYCPYATLLTHGGKTYTVTSATTLTITDCPCTVSWPVWTSTSSSCSSSTASTWGDWTTASTTPAAAATTTWAAGWSATTPAAAVTTPGWSSTTSVYPAFTGAANAMAANVGAGLAGVAGLAALLL